MASSLRAAGLETKEVLANGLVLPQGAGDVPKLPGFATGDWTVRLTRAQPAHRSNTSSDTSSDAHPGPGAHPGTIPRSRHGPRIPERDYEVPRNVWSGRWRCQRRPHPGLHRVRQVQDVAAQLVALLAAPRSGQTVIDLCAAPGGKTTHLAELMVDSGQVIAVELHEKKLGLIRSVTAAMLRTPCLAPPSSLPSSA